MPFLQKLADKPWIFVVFIFHIIYHGIFMNVSSTTQGTNVFAITIFSWLPGLQLTYKHIDI